MAGAGIKQYINGDDVMKILFYNHTAIISGAERVLSFILSQLDAQEFHPEVLCPAGALQQHIIAQNIPCHTVKTLEARFTWRPDYMLRYLLSFVQVIRSVRQQVKQIAPDLIHANSIRAGLVMSAATIGLRIPVIWHLHDLLPHHPISSAIRIFVLLVGRLRVLAVSQATLNRFQGILLRLFPQRVAGKVLLNCANTEKFYPHPISRQTLLGELKLPTDCFLVGCVGQITPRKGQLGLIRAFAAAAAEIPDARLLIAGEPLFTAADQLYQKQLQQTVNELGIANHVHFLGARNDVPALMQGLDLLVVNSLAEPCGLVVLEGMASSLPVVATAVGGNPEMINHSRTGWLIPVNDDRALTHAITKLARQPYTAKLLGRNARLRVSQHFTPAAYMKALEKFYRTSVTRETDRTTRILATASSPSLRSPETP